MTGWQGERVTAYRLRITYHVSRITHHASRIANHRLPITDYRLPLILFLLLLLLFFHKMAFSNLILARGDTFLYFYPYWQAAADALRDGRIPLWNSSLFMGSPFVANSQVGFFYPLNWPVWWLLETPYAVSASILLHLAIAGTGAYLAGRWLLALDGWAAWVTAVLFALGGYITAQVEHINQLQGLAWLPWYLAVIGWCARSSRTKWQTIGWATVAFAFLFAMQLLAGHTQTVFISGLTILLWVTAEFTSQFLLRNTEFGLRFTLHWQRLKRPVPLALMMGGLLALLLTAVQLLPTLELAQHSSRQGGLPPNDVLSFSLHPLLLTRALLPAYGQSLFSEYMAIEPLTAVLLAFIGAWQWRRQPGVLAALVLAAVGLLLAFGVFNPGYWLLARLPGFNLFRVPARWLAVYTLGVALLAGVGFQAALYRYWQRTRPWAELQEQAREQLAHLEQPIRVAIYSIIGLMAWNVLAGFFVFFIPTGAEAPYEAARPWTVLLWLAELLLANWILTGERVGVDRYGRYKLTIKRSRPRSPYWLLPLMLASLFLASRTHPYNNLTTPEAYFDLRPPIARLHSAQSPISNLPISQSPPDRFLSLSNIFFDVGDQAEIDTIYADQLPEAARYDYTVAIKHKEVIGPNLPLAFGLASVDGFDGGILPLATYSQLMRLILPEGVETVDGRLREYLTAVPDPQWLDLFNARYLITDKTGDVWRQAGFMQQSVFFDLQHTLELPAGNAFDIAYVPNFPTSALVMLVEGEPGLVEMQMGDGEIWTLEPFPVESGMVWVGWPPPYDRPRDYRVMTPESITLRAANGDWRILAATLINQEDGTFMPLTLGNYRLIHSGDVKIYENLDVLPRAFLVDEWQWQPDVPASITAMEEAGFDPRVTAVLVGPPPSFVVGDSSPSTGDESPTTNVSQYEPGQVVVETNSDAERLLLLTEAHYPGWRATVNGEPATIYQADGYFQGVFVPAGEHEVQFEFAPDSVGHGRNLSIIALIIWSFLIVALVIGRQRTRFVASS
ncbi:MAG TPA: YfhO family protein [Chloroflexota bacterium]|nr:YfhO family protein [Chloroflexota bacterium]